MSVIESLRDDFNADASALRKGFDEAAKSAAKFQSEIAESTKRLDSTTQRPLAGMAFEDSKPQPDGVHKIKVRVRSETDSLGNRIEEDRDFIAAHPIKASPSVPMLLFFDSSGCVTTRISE